MSHDEVFWRAVQRACVTQKPNDLQVLASLLPPVEMARLRDGVRRSEAASPNTLDANQTALDRNAARFSTTVVSGSSTSS